MNIEWKKQYEIGNLEIDAEHKVFVRIIQKVQHGLERKMNEKYLERLVCELYKYADFHFYSEENVMLAVDYPEIAQHQKEHKQLLMNLSTLIPVFDDENRDLHELIEFLMGWFVNHTIVEDQKVAHYIQEHEKRKV